MANFFISTSHCEPDANVAKSFYEQIRKAGHKVFLASECIKIGENWPERISAELKACEYFIVLISENSLHSDMVTEEIRKVKELQQQSPTDFPVVFPIRLNLSFGSDTNYDLAGYLNRIQQRLWKAESDTVIILNEILDFLKKGKTPELLEDSEIRFSSTKVNDAPLPNAPLEQPAGQVKLDSPFYVTRSDDEKCFQEVLRPGALIRIKAPRQFGKTSLLSRVIQHAKDNDHLVISLSLHFLEKPILSNLESLLKQLCLYSAAKLKVPNNIDEYWVEFEALKMRTSRYFEEYLLENTTKPIVLAIDEADRLFSLQSISDDFFNMMRGWHEEAKVNPVWERLKIVLVHSTEAYLGVNNIHQSPFYNVGYEARLAEFNSDEIKALSIQNGLSLDNGDQRLLIKTLGGHPYLVRCSLFPSSFTIVI